MNEENWGYDDDFVTKQRWAHDTHTTMSRGFFLLMFLQDKKWEISIFLIHIRLFFSQYIIAWDNDNLDSTWRWKTKYVTYILLETIKKKSVLKNTLKQECIISAKMKLLVALVCFALIVSDNLFIYKTLITKKNSKIIGNYCSRCESWFRRYENN